MFDVRSSGLMFVTLSCATAKAPCFAVAASRRQVSARGCRRVRLASGKWLDGKKIKAAFAACQFFNYGINSYLNTGLPRVPPSATPIERHLKR